MPDADPPEGWTDAIPCTVTMLTHNSATTIARALASVSDFAEIIVADGRSSDDTVAIARSGGATIIAQPAEALNAEGALVDYSIARNAMRAEASYRWHLYLDSDEYIDRELVQQIRDIVCNDDGVRGRAVVIANYVINDNVIQEAANYPVRHARLFHSERTTEYRGEIDEKPLLIDGFISTDISDGRLYLPLPSLRIILEKWVRYQRILMARGKTMSAGERKAASSASLRTSRWLTWRLYKIRGADSRLPLRYEVARVAYHLAATASTTIGFALGTLRRRKNT